MLKTRRPSKKTKAYSTGMLPPKFQMRQKQDVMGNQKLVQIVKGEHKGRRGRIIYPKGGLKFSATNLKVNIFLEGDEETTEFKSGYWKPVLEFDSLTNHYDKENTELAKEENQKLKKEIRDKETKEKALEMVEKGKHAIDHPEDTGYCLKCKRDRLFETGTVKPTKTGTITRGKCKCGTKMIKIIKSKEGIRVDFNQAIKDKAKTAMDMSKLTEQLSKKEG